MSSFLGAVVPAGGYDAMKTGQFRTHATSKSPGSSIGRWREDLTREQKDRCAAMWDEFLVSFSYGADGFLMPARHVA